ncbi:MAG: YciI family protein [Methylobacteriaceae bacterium]|nr:YciI family protein [Methylobacteriaceae bacterium]
MQYALIIYEHPQDTARREDPAEAGPYWAGWMAYSQAIGEAGIVVGGAALQPSGTATTVRAGGPARQVQDGPYADTKEQLGGFFLIEVPDLDAALGWAARAPNGVIEVRPVLQRETPAAA